MKSILVDALRQAGSTPEADESDPGAANRPDAQDASTQPAPALPAEFELLETQALIVHAGGDAIAESGLDSRADTPASNDDEQETGRSGSRNTLPTTPGDATLRATVGPRAADATSGNRLLLTLARLSPALCLLLAATAGGVCLLYQNLVTYQVDGQLSGIADHAATKAQDNNGPVSDAPSPFSFVVHAAAQPQALPAAPATRARPRALSAPVASRQTDVETLVATARLPGDAAYQLVLAGYDAYRNGQLTNAERSYRAALDVAPRHAGALEGLAAVLTKTGRPEQAMQTYESLLAVAPSNTAAAAALLASSGKLPANEALGEVKLLLQRHPDSAPLNFSLGALHAKSARWPEARRAFAKACSLQPANADYLFNLAVSLEHVGNIEDAKRYYRQAIETSKPSSAVDRDQLVARLAELESGIGAPQ